MASIDSLIEQNKGLVYKQLHRFNLIDDHDAESLAFEALSKAISTYNSNAGTKLSTYATVLIYNTLGSYVRTLNSRNQLQVISYHSVAYTDDKGEHTFEELLASDEDIEGCYIRSELQKLAMQTFDASYDKLTNERHKEILKAWKDSDFEAQTKEIAVMVGVSQSYVSQVINNFKYTLKKQLEDVYYD